MRSNVITADKSQAGFTLVELAVVMIIIGLLIGGVLKGQELISNAQVTATVGQSKGYDAAITTFRDMYDGLPGDIDGARIAGCTGDCDTAAATVGNGRVDGTFNAPVAGSEALAFWLQLNAADLITGISDTGTVAWGEQLPEAEIGGGYFVGFTTGAAALPAQLGTPARSGHYLALTNDPGATVADGTTGLTPNQAFRIDRKMDDGAPTTGTVRAFGSTCADAATPPAYDEANQAILCGLYIRIQG